MFTRVGTAAAGVCLALFALAGGVPQERLEVRWIHGAEDCTTNIDPPTQVFAFDSETYILRQSKCSNWEAPFLYLFLGASRAYLHDTGAAPENGSEFPLRQAVDELIAQHEERARVTIGELIVGHSHSHTDHVAGDWQFEDRPNTSVVESRVSAIQAFFGIDDWPEEIVEFDLGGRPLVLIPTPGHVDTHVAIGDMLYPGNLYFDAHETFQAYVSSLIRVADLATGRGVSYVLGAHVEMKNEPEQIYPLGSPYQPNEHVLELGLRHLLELRDACVAMGPLPWHEVHDDFVIYPR